MPKELLTPEEKQRLIELGSKRYSSKRNVGISGQRKDGSLCSEKNDIDAIGAEYFATKCFKVPFNHKIHTHGDGGSDFSLSLKTEVIWLGSDKNGNPRESGHLIVNPNEPHRWADIYIVIKGNIDSGFEYVGWIHHKKLISLPLKDFGYGKKFAVNINDLNKGNIKDLFKDL